MMRTKLWSMGILLLSLGGIAALGPWACQSSRSQRFKQCNEKQTQMLDYCRPVCTGSSVEGESLDDCLDRCAKDQFGEVVPTCTDLSSAK